MNTMKLISGAMAILLLASCQPEARLEVSKRVDILVKDTALYSHIWVDHEGVSLYATPEHKEQATPEAKVYFTEFADFQALSEIMTTEEFLSMYAQKGISLLSEESLDRLRTQPSELIETDVQNPLAGKKIAIDPVHIGGSDYMAALEGKLLRVLNAAGDTIKLDEGQLALIVARIMEAKLKKMGAQVLLTRTEPGESGLGKSFDAWLKTDLKKTVSAEKDAGRLTEVDAQFLLEKATPSEIYHQFFIKIDMRARAKKINAFRPDATIMVHFNVHKASKEMKNNELAETTDENYGMAYIPGAFMAGELSMPRDRMDMMRLIASNHLNESQRLASALIQTLNHQLKVPPLTQEQADGLSYLANSSTKVADGVYARNLTMTRWVRGPLCYVEPLCLNNASECELLAKKEVKIGNLVSSKRVEQVADAYLAGLKIFFRASSGETIISPDDLEEQEL